MKSRRSLFALLIAFSFAPASVHANTSAAQAYGKLPLSFERNQGQAPAEVQYLARGGNTTLFLTATEAVIALQQSRREGGRSAQLRMQMVGGSAHGVAEGEGLKEGKVNYLIGSDESRWHTGVPTFARVRYGGVWPGIDLVWHGTRSALEYDFLVEPGADPARIVLQVDGAKKLRLDRDGNLIATTAVGDLVQHAPVLYQESSSGHRTPVRGRYVMRSARRVGFEVGRYDRSCTLVIDPVLRYSTYLGGSGEDDALSIAVDAQGQAYVSGSAATRNGDFPQRGELDTSSGSNAVFVAKLNAAGTDVLYLSLIGADTDGINECFQVPCEVAAAGIAVTSSGKACITGFVVNSENDSEYPVTENAFQKGGVHCLGLCPFNARNTDAFVTMLSEDGARLLYSTFYGGSSFSSGYKADDAATAIDVDAEERIFITGHTNSDDLPMKNPFQRNRNSSREGTDAFVAVFDPNQSRGNDTLLYATYLGGDGDDAGLGIATDGVGTAYVGGSTGSPGLPTKSPAGQALPPLQANFQGGGFDGFVAKFDTEEREDASLTYLTYFGGSVNDRVQAIAVDAQQRTYLTGATNSAPGSFPLRNAFDSVQRNGEAFVAKMNADGTALFYSSFLGGENANTSADFEEGMGIAIDPAGNAYVTGNTTSGDSFPVGVSEPPFPPELRGTAFVAKVEASVSADAIPRLIYSTRFGGDGTKANAIAVDAGGNAYLTGTSTGALPTSANTFQPVFGGERDGFVAKVSSIDTDTTGLYHFSTNQFLLRNSNSAGGPDLTVTFGQAGDLPVVGDWDGDGKTDVGVFRPATGQFILKLRRLVTLQFEGLPGDLPVAGDWDGDGFDTIGLFRPAAGGSTFFLTNAQVGSNAAPPVDITFAGGEVDDQPVAGDWDGDGRDTVGVYRPSILTYFLLDDFATGLVTQVGFGATGDLPLTGDWDGDGIDSVAIYRPSDGTMHLSNDLVNVAVVFAFTAQGDAPLGGNWNGQ